MTKKFTPKAGSFETFPYIVKYNVYIYKNYTIKMNIYLHLSYNYPNEYKQLVLQGHTRWWTYFHLQPNSVSQVEAQVSVVLTFSDISEGIGERFRLKESFFGCCRINNPWPTKCWFLGMKSSQESDLFAVVGMVKEKQHFLKNCNFKRRYCSKSDCILGYSLY